MEYALIAAVLLLAVCGFVTARRLSRRLELLTQSYWELRYEYTRLRSQVSRLDPEAEREPAEPPPPTPSQSFVPLSAIRTKKTSQ